MNIDLPNSEYLLAVLAIALLVLFVRFVKLTKRSDNTPKHLPESQSGTLRPAELSYLLHGGDMSNVMAVLVFDLLHRAVKGGGELPLTDYEQRLWSKVKEYATQIAQQEVSKVLPVLNQDSWIQVVSKLRAIYGFLMVTVREFLGQVLADPRRLKRYFSLAGLLKLVADLAGSGYQQMVRVEMQAHLISQGWLQMEQAKLAESRRLLIISLLAMLTLLFAAFITLKNVGLAVSVITVATLVAALLKLLWSALDFLPYYSEIKEILRHLKRSGWRVLLFKFIVNLIGFAALGTTIALTLLCLAAGTAMLAWGFQLSPATTLLLLLPTIAVMILLVDTLWTSHHIRWNALQTPEAAIVIKGYRKKLAHQSPLAVLREMLLSDQYSPLFSELLAVYGLEMLLLLA